MRLDQLELTEENVVASKRVKNVRTGTILIQRPVLRQL
jgi:hypothetical protein